jgi:polygalacturonase
MLWTLIECDHVLVDGITLNGSPDWNFMIWNSSYVTVQNVAITAVSNSTTLASKSGPDSLRAMSRGRG